MTSSYASRIGSFLPNQSDLNDFAVKPSARRLLKAFDRQVTWLRHFHNLHRGDEVSVLLASAHSKVIEIWILMPLGLLHSSYTALRTIVDISTSYTFYRSHPMEWRAICESRAAWEGRGRIIDWHVNYTRSFREMSKSFGLVDALTKDYQRLSDYVHSIPVTGLPTLKGITRTCVADSDLNTFVEMAESVDYNLNLLFLGIAHRDTSTLSPEDFRTIMRDIDRSKLAESGIVLPRT